MNRGSLSVEFESLVNEIAGIGRKHHAKQLMAHTISNISNIKKSLKDLSPLTGTKARSGIIISAGPSLKRKNSLKRIAESGYKGTLIVTDGAYIACLKAKLIPDYVLTLDPHSTRIARWFGDPEFEKNFRGDDYFERQDLNIEFRKNNLLQNQEHIELVNKYGHLTKAIVSSSAPRNVMQRLKEARFDLYGWNPLVDNPNLKGSLTRRLHHMNKLPCMNTGGTVGTAAWVFATAILKLPLVALVGMDFGYYSDTPITQTQTYYELKERLGKKGNIHKYFAKYSCPLTGEKFYTDPIYFWYRKNFLELLEKAQNVTVNCTEGGTLHHQKLKNIPLDEFLLNV